MLKNKRNIWGLVLSGGMSKRMGQDKALIEIDGNTQLNKTYTLLQNHLPEVFVSSRADQSPSVDTSRSAEHRRPRGGSLTTG